VIYNFSFIISEPNIEEAAELFYKAGCNDALFSVSNGIYEIEFDRDAPSLEEAILSARHDVEMSGTGSVILNIIAA